MIWIHKTTGATSRMAPAEKMADKQGYPDFNPAEWVELTVSDKDVLEVVLRLEVVFGGGEKTSDLIQDIYLFGLKQGKEMTG